MSKAKKWTRKEMNYLKCNYGKILAVDIARKLGKSYSAIRQKAKKNGLKSKLDNSPKQIKKMKEKKSTPLKKSAYKPSNELSYILGVLVGDGHLGKRRIGLLCTDEDFILYFAKNLEKWSGLKTKFYKYKNHRYKKGFNYQLYLNSVKATEFLKQFDLNKNKENPQFTKKINSFLKNKNHKIKFIEGFFDSEGSIRTNNRITLDNSNKEIINYIQQLLKKLRINFKIYEEKNHHNKLLYRINIQTKKDIIQFCKLINSSIKRKQIRMNQNS